MPDKEADRNVSGIDQDLEAGSLDAERIHSHSESDSVHPNPKTSKLRIKLPQIEKGSGNGSTPSTHNESTNADGGVNEHEGRKEKNGSSSSSAKTPHGFSASKPSSGASSFLSNFFHGRLRAKLQETGLWPDTSWVTKNLEFTRFKPVLRAATAAWISLLFIIISPIETLMGQAGFLIIVASFLSPPFEPFMQVLEKEIFLLTVATVSYAWTCLGVFFASLARKNFDLNASQQDIFHGVYIEAGPAAISAAFLFIGTGFLLYTRARVGPGPFAVTFILSCIVMDITLPTTHLYPYANYQVGVAVIKPLALHSAVSIVCSIFILPETVNAQFIKRFRNLFLPLGRAIRTQKHIFSVSAMSEDFDPHPFFKEVESAEAALAPLAATSRILKRDLSWGRFGSKDFSRLHELARVMALRANGMAFYFRIMDSHQNKMPGTPAFSLLNTPAGSPAPSRLPSPTPSQTDLSLSPSNASIASTPRRRRQLSSHRSRQRHSVANLYHHTLSHAHTQNHPQHNHLNHIFHHFHHHRHSHSSPSFQVGAGPDGPYENAVGVFETQRYLNLEERLTHPDAEAFIPQIVQLMGEGSEELREVCAETLEYLGECFSRMNEYRFAKLFGRRRRRTWSETIQDKEAVRAKLQDAIDAFREDKRLKVLDLYRDHVDSHLSPDSEAPPHRYLFQCYMYQYHLLFFSKNLCKFVEELIDLEKTRPHSRLWLPILPLNQVLFWSRWEPTDEALVHNDDEDPDMIQGIDPVKTRSDLGEPMRRDPDALPPSNKLEAIGAALFHTTSALGHGNAVFGFKAGLLSVLLSLPDFFPQSSYFVYTNRSVWALIIGQLTLSRFRGDTTFGWFSRILATFCGGLMGAVMWYISTGRGTGNAYGLSVVSAVVFPVIYFIRLYFPASPVTLTIFTLTVGLVVGYSWQDEHMVLLTDSGEGVGVAWKRFLLVTIGVTVAFLFSFLPPTTTLRRYLRTTYATTAEQIGQAYCDVLSFATVHDSPLTEAIIKELIANRLKLRRSKALMTNVVYEFSLQGKWPKERYEAICQIQLEIGYLLSHLRSVHEHLELSWARAFMKRTRFHDPEFQGDVLAVISLISTSLRTGTPLPQVTPCPLLDRFLVARNGLSVLRAEDHDLAEEYGLPRHLNMDTLQNEQYLYFCVGLTTAFGIITRLDRLMMATKELVGEQFHIHGLPVCMPRKHAH